MKRQAQRLCALKEIPAGRGKKMNLGKLQIALFRRGEKVFALQNRCPHQGADLADGHIHNGAVVCPLHQWSFLLENGRYSFNPDMYLRTFKTEIRNGDVYLLPDE